MGEDATHPGRLAGLSDGSSRGRLSNALFLVQCKLANLVSAIACQSVSHI